MTLQSAILESSREVLRELLAPELAEKLATRIVERAQGRIEEAVGEFFAFDAQRDTGRRKGVRQKGPGRPRDEVAEEPEGLEGAEAGESEAA
jgi:hypothetical protein